MRGGEVKSPAIKSSIPGSGFDFGSNAGSESFRVSGKGKERRCHQP